MQPGRDAACQHVPCRHWKRRLVLEPDLSMPAHRLGCGCHAGAVPGCPNFSCMNYAKRVPYSRHSAEHYARLCDHHRSPTCQQLVVVNAAVGALSGPQPQSPCPTTHHPAGDHAAGQPAQRLAGGVHSGRAHPQASGHMPLLPQVSQPQEAHRGQLLATGGE